VSSPERAPEREPGALFLHEIHEQPRALRALLEHDAEFATVADVARERGRLVRFVGHGSSDNAATYGVYSFGLLAGWTAVRDSIALSVYFGAETEMSNSTVVALSQSGRTPDVVEYVRRARRAGAYTVALTNDAGSELAHVAEAVLQLAAGEERAVAATKTYVNQLAALALLAGHCGGQGERVAAGLRSVAEQLETALPELESQARGLAAPFAFVGRMFVIGRGPEFATAREIALKLLETCRTAAWPLTATDLAHGPVAVLDPLFPVARRDAARRAGGRRARAGVRGNDRRERRRSRRDRRRAVRPAGARAGASDSLADPLGGPRPVVRGGTRACERPQPGSSARPLEGHARALTRAAA